MTRVVQIKKKCGESDLIANYRPISWTSTSCKLLEPIVNEQLVNFTEENNTILSPGQHGVRTGLSTTAELI